MQGRRSPRWLIGLVSLALLGLSACSSRVPDTVGVYKVGNPYQIAGRWYHPVFDESYDQTGIASWYGDPFHGRATANGEFFDKARMTAAHPTLPLPSMVRVTNLSNRRSTVLRVNDRGPFIDDRIIDVSQAAARELGFERHGLAPVRVEFLHLAHARGEPPQPVVADRSPTAATQVARVETGSRCFAEGGFIQVGAFAETGRAEQLASQLQYHVRAPVRAEPPGPDRLARVRLGPIPDPRDLEATLRQLEQIGLSSAFVVQPEIREVC
jgi:rare lipoprotein A